MNDLVTMIESDPSAQRREEIETLRARRHNALREASRMRAIEKQARAHAEEYERIAETNSTALSAYGIREEAIPMRDDALMGRKP